MRTTRRAFILFFAALFSASGAGAAPETPRPTEPEPRGAGEEAEPEGEAEEPATRQLDRGVFVVFVGEARMGRERFRITELGEGFLVRTELRLQTDEDVLTSSAELKLDEAWTPIEGHSRLETSEGEEVSVRLSTVEGYLEQETRIGAGPPSTLRADVEDVDLYLGEASVTFATPLCHEEDLEREQVTVFPGTDLPVKRAIWLVAPERQEDATAEVLTLVMLDPESTDPLVALCSQEDLVLVWLPAIELAAGREGFEQMARQLASESAGLE